MRQWVYPPKSCVMWSRTSTLWIEAHIFVNEGWKSMKLIYKQKAVKLLKYRDFLYETWYHKNKITLLFYPKMGVVSHVWTKRPPIGLKCPPLGILSHHIDKNQNNIFNYSNFIYILTGLVLDRMPSLGQPLLPSGGGIAEGASRRQGPVTQSRLIMNWST